MEKNMRARIKTFGNDLEITLNLFEELSQKDRRQIIESFVFTDDSAECEDFRREIFEALKAMGYE